MSDRDPRLRHDGDADWPEVLATVTRCTYDAGAGRAMAFGAPREKHFRIAYNFWAQGELHAAEFYSDTALAQGELFPIRVDLSALHPQAHSATEPVSRKTLLTIGVLGSVVLSLAYALFLHGCSRR